MRRRQPQGQGSPGRGWVKAPSGVEMEIRTVWQEDEMPEELTSTPGYRPFTLGPDAQTWVDAMAEVVDGGHAVYGRTEPAAAITHASLSSTSPPSALRTPVTITPPPAARVQPQPVHRPVQMPDIATPAPNPVRTLPRRIEMPEIGGASMPTPPEHSSMPEIGSDASNARTPRGRARGTRDDPSARRAPHEVMPEIGDDGSKARPHRDTMPEMGGSAPRPAPAHESMPHIGVDGTETAAEQESMPEIGGNAPKRRSRHDAMPEIGDDEPTSRLT